MPHLARAILRGSFPGVSRGIELYETVKDISQSSALNKFVFYFQYVVPCGNYKPTFANFNSRSWQLWNGRVKCRRQCRRIICARTMCVWDCWHGALQSASNATVTIDAEFRTIWSAILRRGVCKMCESKFRTRLDLNRALKIVWTRHQRAWPNETDSHDIRSFLFIIYNTVKSRLMNLQDVKPRGTE